MVNEPGISVIVPTLATPERAPYLRRALKSIQSQAGISVTPIVVANGDRCCPTLLAELEAEPNLRCIRLRQGNLPAALEAGRAQVKTEFFSELDDDDILLPGALDLRLRHLQANPTVDMVVTNGYIRDNGEERLSIPNIAELRRDPVRTLMQYNWLLPGAALFRTGTVTPDLFANIPMYLEWTYLALLLVTKRNVSFLDEPTLVYFADHPFSISRSIECCVGRAHALESLLEMDLSAFVKRRIRRRVADCHHSASSLWLDRGCLGKAWAAHWRSLLGRGGWRYVPYTRRLLFPYFRPLAQKPQPFRAPLD